jgi:hypothetical protein
MEKHVFHFTREIGSALSTTPSYAPQNRATSASKTKGIVSLVLGIVAVVTGFLIPIVGILAGIAAVILGFLSRRSEPAARPLALTGIITGFAGIALGVVMWIVNAIAIAAVLQQ